MFKCPPSVSSDLETPPLNSGPPLRGGAAPSVNGPKGGGGGKMKVHADRTRWLSYTGGTNTLAGTHPRKAWWQLLQISAGWGNGDHTVGQTVARVRCASVSLKLLCGPRPAASQPA
eukprot:gene19644-biopygen19060